MGALALSGLSGLAYCKKLTGFIDLAFGFDGDDKGLVYYLGTNGLTETFQNPQPSRLIGQLSSNIDYLATGYGIVNSTDRAAINPSHTDDLASSWMGYRLPVGQSIEINHYSLRTRPDNDSQHPYHWVLEVSNDVDSLGWASATWTIVHTVDYAAGAYTGINVWLSHDVPIANRVRANAWRIRQTAVNSTGANYLIYGEIEFYGRYYPV